MKTVVIYDSVFGNTKIVAETIGNTLKNQCETQIVHVDQISPAHLKQTDLLILGSPTRGFEPTKPVVNYLKGIHQKDYPAIKIAVFDTRMDIVKVNNKILTFFVKIRGYALDTMEKIVRKNGFSIFHPGEGFFVEDSEGPLSTGEQQRAETWANSVYQKSLT